MREEKSNVCAGLVIINNQKSIGPDREQFSSIRLSVPAKITGKDKQPMDVVINNRHQLRQRYGNGTLFGVCYKIK